MNEFVISLVLLGAVLWAGPYFLMTLALWGLAHGIHCPINVGSPAEGCKDSGEYMRRMVGRGLVAGGWVLMVGLPLAWIIS